MNTTNDNATAEITKTDAAAQPGRKAKATKAKAKKPAKTKAKAKPKTKAKAKAAAKAKPATARADSKQARFIAAMRTARGMSITEAAEEFGWQAHTVRGAIAGAIKKRLGLKVTSEQDEKRGTVYRIK